MTWIWNRIAKYVVAPDRYSAALHRDRCASTLGVFGKGEIMNHSRQSNEMARINQGGWNIMTIDDMRVIAYHEAGHAVVAWSLGLLINEVRIEPNGGICKHAMTISPLLDPEFMGKSDWAKVEKKALILLAGEIAEQVGGKMARLAGDDEVAELCSYAHSASLESTVPGSDREELRELAELIFGDIGTEANEWIEKSMAKAEDIILGHWKKICSLSNALVEKNVLSGAEAIRIIEMAE